MKEATQWSISLRPTRLQDVYGLDKIKKYFYKASMTDTYPNAILLQGNVGAGKTTVSKIIASMIVTPNKKPVLNEKGGIIGYDPDLDSPSVKAIVDETFNRDVIMVGTGANTETIQNLLTTFAATPPFKDKAKVIMIEEVQKLDKAAIQLLLKVIESKKANIYYIFTSMVDMSSSGSDSVAAAFTALKSRCVTFKYPPLQYIDIMKYLHNVMIQTGYEADESIPQEFKTYGLKAIAESSEGSIRTGLQKMQQCIMMEAFTLKEIQEECGIVSIDDFYTTLIHLVKGEATDELFETLVNVNDYDGMIRLSVLAFANAESYRLFGKVNSYNSGIKNKDSTDTEEMQSFLKRVLANKENGRIASEWQQKKTAGDVSELIKLPNYELAREMFVDFYKDNAIYTSKSAYVLGMCKIIDACKKNVYEVNNEVENLLKDVETQMSPLPKEPPEQKPIGRRIIK